MVNGALQQSGFIPPSSDTYTQGGTTIPSGGDTSSGAVPISLEAGVWQTLSEEEKANIIGENIFQRATLSNPLQYCNQLLLKS